MLFTSKGVAGVAGAGFVALAATILALGMLPIGGLALLLGVDRFMSEIRTDTNLFSNLSAGEAHASRERPRCSLPRLA